MEIKKFVILGNGIAGLTAATEIRKHDETAEITIISEESYLSYSRPMMTKAPLKGFDVSKFMIKSEDWYKEKNIKVLTDTLVTKINPESKSITLDDNSEIFYDKCIYALGARSFVPPISGSDQEHVLTIRTIQDIADLRTLMLTSKSAVVIGGGVIGLEAAWEIKKAGLEVTVLEQAPHLMGALLDHQSAKSLEDKTLESGIKVRTGVNIAEISEDNKVMLTDGSSYSADIVILSCGIRANTHLASEAGIEINRAVIVNDKMETNIKDIYACGDCAEYQGVNYGLWEQSLKQAKVAAANSCGKDMHYDGIEKAVVFNGMKTSLFAMGDLAGDTIFNKVQGKKPEHFMVNQPNSLSDSYEKYFFKNNRLVGGVLLGDLRKMSIIKTAIQENWSLDKFESEVVEC